VKVLDRFAIDYALCMYCGICVEVCPFDALFWAPDFEYAEYDILNMTHEKERLEEWTYRVLPPPPLEVGAEPLPTPEEVPVQTGGGQAVTARPPSAEETSAPGAQPPAEMAPARAEPQTAPPSPQPAAATAEVPPAAAPARPAGERHEAEPDQETLDRVLAEELAKGTDRRVAEGRARAAAVRAARRKAEGG
jgi:NADH-quinone oxidoreductase subunit I